MFSEPNERIVPLVRDALQAFDDLEPSAKRCILEGAAIAIAAGTELEPRDVEMLRAIGKSIGCVLPPQADLRRTEAQDGPTPQSANGRVLADMWTDEIAELLANQ